jgi:hypothetical protein
LLATICELVPECVSPLKESATARPAMTVSTAHAMETWGGLANPDEIQWRGRRRVPPPPRPSHPPELKVIDRRDGPPCRRKTPRVGGRRKSDRAGACP